MLKVLGCANDHAAVAQAIRGWDGAALDQALADAGLCAALIRSPREWAALPQAQAIGEAAVAGDRPHRRCAAAKPMARRARDRPLAGVRVLDLSRIIAGPVAGRTLAQHGARCC